MSLRTEELVGIIEELMNPRDGDATDIPTFRAMPAEMVRTVAARRNIDLTSEDARVVGATLAHPFAIGTWNLTSRAPEEAEVSALRIARPAFRYAVAMHATMVLLGLALLGFSLAASLRGSPQLAAALGAIGLASFTSVFLVAPLRDLRRSLGRRVQLEVIGLGYQHQMDLYRMFARSADQSDQFLIDAFVVPQITAISARTVQLVEALGDAETLANTAASSGGATPLVMRAVLRQGETSGGDGHPTGAQMSKLPLEGKMILMDKPPTMDTSHPSEEASEP